MKSDNHRITTSHLSIDFPIYDTASRSLRHSLVLAPLSSIMRGTPYIGGNISHQKNGVIVVRALEDVSFEIKPGERVGLIGHNGAGKTTLLRTIAGIYEPTAGTIEAFGRIMPLFNLTEGMSADSTGREFIRIRCVLLGFEPDEIEYVTQDVIAFSELGAYIDLPIRTYSMGMLVRLAFGIVTSVTSDILLFDELISAGDARFTAKAEPRLANFINRSRMMVVASHNDGILKMWCTRAFLMEHGRIIFDGGVEEALEVYKERQAKQDKEAAADPAPSA